VAGEVQWSTLNRGLLFQTDVSRFDPVFTGNRASLANIILIVAMDFRKDKESGARKQSIDFSL
jgi:hypothetical protein